MDAIVIGAGPNGLTTAALLARSGRRVALVEQRATLGGLYAREEFAPGFFVPGILHETAGARRGLLQSLKLEELGLSWRSEPAIVAPSADGPGLRLQRRQAAPRVEGELPAGEQARLERFYAFIERVAPFVNAVIDRAPPDPLLSLAPRPGRLAPELSDLGEGLAELFELARTALDFRRLGGDPMIELMRLGPMCAGDWLKDAFTSDALRGLMVLPAVAATWLGPWSAGSAANLLLHECSTIEAQEVVGGPAALTAALEARCRAERVEIVSGNGVKSIRVRHNRVVGVLLDDGQVLDASIVAASCDPKQTLLDLVDPAQLPLRLEHQARVFRMRGTTAKLHLGLSGTPRVLGQFGAGCESLRIGESLDAVERAFDAIKYGRFSDQPALEVRIPSVSDASLCPTGHSVLSVLVHFAPYALRAGWSDDTRTALTQTVVTRLEQVMPGLRDQIVAQQMLTPADLAQRYRLTGGQLRHGEHALDQLLFMRPSASCARYATPIQGLWFCGSGSHPGGGFAGAAGALAAAAISRGQ